jgi:hypothetical protein
VIVYGDFNCPYSYLASMHVDALLRAGYPIEWRAVERAPFLPVGGRRLDDTAQAELDDELQRLRELAFGREELPRTPATFTPNTKAAVVAYTEAVGAGVGNDVRRLLFDAYWKSGLDISSPDLLRTLLAPAIRSGSSTAFPLREAGFAVSMARGPITVSAYRRGCEWHDAWVEVGTGITPTLIDGKLTLTGESALVRMSAYLPTSELAPQLRRATVSSSGTVSAFAAA